MESRGDGFSLVEMLIATSLLAVSLSALAQLSAIAARNNLTARHRSIATVLAAQKIEELLADQAFSPSPAGTLEMDTGGYVDYIDNYVRRWSLQPISGASAVAIQVLVTREGEPPELLSTVRRTPP